MTIWALGQALDRADAGALEKTAPGAFEENPVSTALMLTAVSAPYAALRPSALHSLGALLQTAPPLVIRSLDQAFRSSRRLTEFGVEIGRHTHGDLVDERTHPPAGGAILASLSRDGYLRSEAVAALGGQRGPGIINALLVRTSDPVTPVREAAVDYIRGALTRATTPDSTFDDDRRQFAHALPLVEQMQTWARTRAGGLPSDIAKMLTTTEGGRAALNAATQSEDIATRQAALRVALDSGAPGHAQQLAIVGAALMDENPRIRLAATRQALSDVSIAKSFYERLHVDKSPHIRALAVRSRTKFAMENADDDGAHEAAQRATFDHNANVRFWARQLVLKFGSPLDYRGRAQAILGASLNRSNSSTFQPEPWSDLVGALAILSELGRGDDVELVDAFTRHPRAKVSREARRTLEILRTL